MRIESVRCLLRTDLRILLRSPRTLMVSVVLPMVIWPIVLVVNLQIRSDQEERIADTTFEFAVAGTGNELLRDLLDELPLDELRFAEKQVRDPDRSLQDEEIHFYIRSRDASPVGARSDETNEEANPEIPVPGFELYHRADRELSREGARKLIDELEKLRDSRRQALLEERGFPLPPIEVGRISVEDLASAESASGLQLGRFLPFAILLFLVAGGSVVASDSLAGEKERGTLETLLTTALERSDLILAKLLSIVVVAVAITAIQLLNLLVYLGLGFIELPDGFTIPITPQLTLVLLVLFLPVAFLVANALLLASAYAKTYKEAQLYYFPTFIALLLPTAAPFLPTLRLQSAMVAVPIANLSLAIKDVLSGTADWPWIAAAWLVTGLAATGLARLSTRILTRENLISIDDSEAAAWLGGEPLLRRDVLRWAAALWAIILIGSMFVGSEASVAQQLAFNFGLLLLATAMMIRRYRLRTQDALHLHWPHPLAWPAVVVGAPSALLLGVGLVQWTNRILPVPESVLEAFEQALIPEEMPAWKLLLLLAVFPGIVEEIFFRGILLYGLQRHSTVTKVALSAVVFALFHVSFFRLLPTAYLGALLALATLYSGSIFPAMLWHTLNNALGIYFDIAAAAMQPRWLLLAAAGLTTSIWLLRASGSRRYLRQPDPM